MPSLRALEPTLQTKAENEINENASRIEEDLRAFREWLKKQPHLHLVQPTDQWLVAFLRGSKFSLERSKEKFEMYYTMKTLVPEFYADRDPLAPKIQDILKLGAFLPLRKCDKSDSTRPCIMRLGLFSSDVNLTDLIKVALMTTEIMMMEDDNFIVAGEEMILDMKDIGVSMLSQWTPALAKKSITCLEKALPVRVKGNHILNTPLGFETVYSILKMCLGEKMKKRIQVHNQNYEGMYKSIPKSVLPKEYGGEDGSLDDLIDYWKIKIESYRDWFLEQEHVKSDESKRSGKPKDTSTVFGVEGSFRKLEVD